MQNFPKRNEFFNYINTIKYITFTSFIKAKSGCVQPNHLTCFTNINTPGQNDSPQKSGRNDPPMKHGRNDPPQLGRNDSPRKSDRNDPGRNNLTERE